MTPPRLQIRDLCKSYAVPVLVGVDFDVAAGEVHALVGENGAGKSTLCKIICGLVPPSAGTLRIDGKPYSPSTINAAGASGVRMVGQELSIVSTLSAAENIFLDGFSDFAGSTGVINRKALHRQARAVMDDVGLTTVSTHELAGNLGVGQQQMLEIARALTRPCRILILDEPTAALTSREVDLLFDRVRALSQAGTAVLYISHRLEEIKTICDTISVLRDGRLVCTRAAQELPTNEMIKLMVGASSGLPDEAPQPAASLHNQCALSVSNLQTDNGVKGVSFQVARGEILGFAGLMGAGRTETMRALFAADPLTQGEIRLGPEQTPVSFRTPADAVAHGLAFVTEDRKQEGLLLPLSIRSNLGMLRLRSWSNVGGVDSTAENQAVKALVSELQIRCHSVEQPVEELSGGNQQKVLIGRWLANDPQVLIFDEPTRGIDVGARKQIYRLLRRLAEQGKAIIVVSSDMPELIELCHRVAVMAHGRIVETFALTPMGTDDALQLSQRMLAAAFDNPTHTACASFERQ